MAASTRVWETQGRWFWLFSRLNTDGEVDSKKFALLIYFSTDFTPKATESTKLFQFGLNLEPLFETRSVGD